MAHLQIRLQRAIAGQLQQQRATIDQLQNKLLGQSPEQTISYGQQRITQSVKHLMRSIQQQLANKQTKTNQAMHLLDTVSPLSTLGRGYAIIRDQDNAVIKTVKEVGTGDQLTGQLADGEIVVSVSATTTKTL